jgi:hypothetical protein
MNTIMKIISIVANNPIFIELQYKTLNKFVTIDYEYIIFNDGKDWPDITNFENVSEGKDGIIKKCDELNITCINIPNKHNQFNNSASQRHADSLRFVFNYMINHPDEYLMLDSDMFIIDHFDININTYRKYSCACVLQERPNLLYIWPNLFYINMNTIKNIKLLDFTIITGGDTGSASHNWLKSFAYDYPSVKNIRYTDTQYSNDDFYFIKHLWSCSWNKAELPSNLNMKILEFLNFDKRNHGGDTFFCEIYDKKILHYRAGTNWMNQPKELHHENILKLVSTINDIIM